MNNRIYRKPRPIMAVNAADRYTTIMDTVAENLVALTYTVYKRKGAVIRESDVFPCVVIAPSEEGEELGIEAFGGISEYIYSIRVYYIQEYARDLVYTDLDDRYKIRKEVFQIGQFPGSISPSRVMVKGIQPFSVNSNPNVVYNVTGFRVSYGFMEQGLI
jgi:hypothetical protein